MLLSNDSDKNKLNIQRISRFIQFKRKSIVTEIFYPIIITTYIWECNKINYVFQQWCDIPLLLPINTKEIESGKIKFELVNLIDFFQRRHYTNCYKM